MLAFNAFDPYAILAGRATPAAKPANVAKVDVAPRPTLAGLATLAWQYPRFHHAPDTNTAARDAADWREYFDERASVAEHDGGMMRGEAEKQAYGACITRWLDMNPPTNANDAICPHCQKPNGAPGTSSIPTLTGSGGHLWLHHACLPSWLASRRQKAITALASIGIGG